MNKKGFALSVIIYIIFAIFLIAIGIMIFIINNNASVDKILKEKPIKDIDKDTKNESKEKVTTESELPN